MNNKELLQLKYTKKKALVREIIKGYNLKSQSDEIQRLLGNMSADETIVMEKDFLKRSSSLWYENYWCKTTYYKIKHRVVDNILKNTYAR